MPKHLIGLIAALHLLVFSGDLNAGNRGNAETVTHSVTVKTINQTLAGQFPFSKSFQGIRVIFSEPNAVINSLDKTLKLQMMITRSEADKMLVAKAVFKGNIQFDDFSESYLFEGLVLDTLKIQIDSFTDSKPVVKAIKQSLINDFDDIVLIKLEQFSSELPNRQADEIDISLNQLQFTWQR
jgi:hypothetical protein